MPSAFSFYLIRLSDIEGSNLDKNVICAILPKQPIQHFYHFICLLKGFRQMKCCIINPAPLKDYGSILCCLRTHQWR